MLSSAKLLAKAHIGIPGENATFCRLDRDSLLLLLLLLLLLFYSHETTTRLMSATSLVTG